MAQTGGGIFIPGSGSLSQVLTMLRKLAVSPTMRAEMAAGAAGLVPGQFVFALNSPSTRVPPYTVPATPPPPFETIDLGEESLRPGWADDHVKSAVVGDAAVVEITPPYPVVHVQPGPVSSGFDEQNVREDRYKIAVDIHAGSDMQHIAWHKSLVIGEAFRRLLRRDETLGGLVRWVKCSSPESSGVSNHQAPVVYVCRLTLDVGVIVP